MNVTHYRIPTLAINSREDLMHFLQETPPLCVFENIEEVLNPVGFQWNYTLTAKTESEETGVFIVQYKEAIYEKPNTSGITADWLRVAIPNTKHWYKGEIKP